MSENEHAHSQDDCVVSGAGLVTSLAWDVRQTCAAIAAGVASFREIDDFATSEGDAAVGAVVEGLNRAQKPRERILAMASSAIREASGVTDARRELPEPTRTALFFCLPVFEEFEPVDALTESLQATLAEIGFGRLSKTVIARGGNAIGFRAVRQAIRNLAEGTIDCALVGAADTLVHRQSLQRLESCGRLKTSTHPEGLIPGESAAFVLLERESAARRRGERTFATLRCSGYVNGEVTRESGDPIRGIVLAEAIRKALRRSDESSPFDFVLCDLNGERARMMEWALARSRALAGLEIDPPLWHPAEFWGELGVASSIALLAAGAVGVGEQWIPKKDVLLWAASDDGDRGSVALTLPARSSQTSAPGSVPLGKARPSVRLWKSHSEEAAYLYEVRHPRRGHCRTEWEDLRRWEERMNPHLRALLLGGFECAQYVRDRYLGDEDAWSGETFVAAWVCASVPAIEPMQWIADALGGKCKNSPAIVHALVRSPRADLEEWVGDFLADPRTEMRQAGLEVAARRGMNQHEPLVRELARDPDAGLSGLASMTLASLGEKLRADAVLETIGSIHDAAVVRRILIELLRRGESSAVRVCRELRSSEDGEVRSVATSLLAAVGSRRDRMELAKEAAAAERATSDLLLAAAFTGSPSTAETLTEHLMSEEAGIFQAAFQGLQLLSGEDHLPPFDLEDATNEERLVYRDFWMDWWKGVRKSMSLEEIWRRGRPISPGVLAKDLTWAGHPDRELAGLQLSARYGFAEEFRLDDEFPRLREVVRSADAWAKAQMRNFTEGRGYFAGALEPDRGGFS